MCYMCQYSDEYNQPRDYSDFWDYPDTQIYGVTLNDGPVFRDDVIEDTRPDNPDPDDKYNDVEFVDPLWEDDEYRK